MIELKGKYTDAKIFIDNVEEGVFQQVYEIINSPTSKGLKVRVMPDTHVGSGVCVGMSMELGEFLNVNVVGCDIGCGVTGARFSTKKPIDLKELESYIREHIPTGFNIHETSVVNELDFYEIQKIADLFVKKYNEKFKTSYVAPTYNEKWLSNKLKEIKMDEDKFWKSLSTMGGNNHFLELGQDQELNYWITVHSGSRNLGIKIFDYWSNVANGKVNVASKEYNDELQNIILNTVPKSDIPKKIQQLKEKYSLGINKGFIYGDNLMGYIFDMIFTQYWAYINRISMLNVIKDGLNIKKYDEIINTTHNYIDMNDMVVRKGAVRSYIGEKFLLPFNMRDGILILSGLSNPDWLCTSPHGSGRLFSRGHAKKNIDFEEYKKSMKGIYTTSVNRDTIDESPQSYKSSKLIEQLIQDTAVVLNRIKPLMNIKDTGKSVSWKEKKLEKKKRDLEREQQRKMKRID